MKLVIIFSMLVLLFSGIAFASPGIIVYVNTSASTTIPQYRTWNTTSFTAQASVGIQTGTLQWLKVVTNPVKDEAIVGSLNSNGDIIFAVYNATANTWGNSINVSSIGTTHNDKMAFDIAYESLSGRAIVVYANGTGNTAAAYRTWNGSDWSVDSLTATDECTGSPSWVRAESVPRSNKIVIADFNITTSDICAQVWNGTAWINATTLTPIAEVTTPKRIFDIAPEWVSERIMVAFAEDRGTTSVMNYTIYNASSQSWTSLAAIPIGSVSLTSNIQWISLGSDYDSSRIVYAHSDTTSLDLNIWHWNGTEWGTGAEPDTSIETTNFKGVEAGFAGGNGTVLYGSGSNPDTDFTHVRCTTEANCQAGTWTAAATVSDCGGNINWVNLYQDPLDKSSSMAVTISQAATNNVCIRQFTGSSWEAATNVVGTAPTSFESASFAYFSNPSILNVSFNLPAAPIEVIQNRTFTVNATVTCIGITGAVCGVPTAAVRYNDSSSNPDSNVSRTIALPFFVVNSTYDLFFIPVWNRNENPGFVDVARGVDIDSNGNIVVVGYQDDGVGVDWRIMYFNSSGVSLWNRTENPGVLDIATGLAVDSSGNIVVVGYQDNADWRIMYFNSSGVSLWNRTENPGTTDVARGVDIDSNGNIVVVGYQDNADWRIMKFNSSGVSLWNRTENPGTEDRAHSVAIDNNGDIVVVGYENVNNWGIRKYYPNKNPAECPSALLAGNSCNIQWQVNATGAIGQYYWTDVNFTSSLSSVISNDTADRQVRIVEYACGTPVTASLRLSLHHTSTSTCITAAANSIVIDGQGYNITGSGSGIGINISGFHNVTVRNFRDIMNFTTGVNLSNTENFTLLNATIDAFNATGAYGIYIEASNFTNLSENTITTYGSDGYGFLLNSLMNGIFSSNNITTFGLNAHSVLMMNSVNNSFLNGFINSTLGKELNILNSSLDKFTYVLLDRVNFTSHNLTNVTIDAFTERQPDPANKQNLSYYLNITNLSSSSYIDFNITYLSSDIPAQMQESTVRMYHYNESSSQWEVLAGSTVDTLLNIVSSGLVTSFSAFGIFGDTASAYLEVNLSRPNTFLISNAPQNRTFVVNATVYCRGGDCSNVNGTLLYNSTTGDPDTYINTTEGDTPFYVNESPALAAKDCPTNPLVQDEYCNLTWIINATGPIGSAWKFDVLFQSSDEAVTVNATRGANVSIISCAVDFTLQWDYVDFGEQVPNTFQNAAIGNGVGYNIDVNGGSCATDLYVKGTNMTNSSFTTYIGTGNVTWSNVSNTYPTSANLSDIYSVIQQNVQELTTVTTWYWINVPPVYAGIYNGTITIAGVENGQGI